MRLDRRFGHRLTGSDQVADLDHFCLKVEPFKDEDIMEHLRNCGVKFEPLRELYGADGYGPSIYFYDPEGNKVELKG